MQEWVCNFGFFPICYVYVIFFLLQNQVREEFLNKSDQTNTHNTFYPIRILCMQGMPNSPVVPFPDSSTITFKSTMEPTCLAGKERYRLCTQGNIHSFPLYS